MPRTPHPLSTACATLLLAAATGLAPAVAGAADPALQAQALDILQKSVAFRTVAGAGQVPAYAEFLKGVLVQAGFAPEDVRVQPMGDTATLVARYHGRDRARKPILVIGHMDVVEAKREDWTRDPFVPVVENGYLFGRGSMDNKFELSVIVATLAQLKREGWQPGRDVVLALTGDEETDMVTTRALAQEFKDAELVLNGDAGGGSLDEAGRPVLYSLQAGEKTYADYTVRFTDAGGHSSRPGPNNPIYRLAAALRKLEAYRFPVMQNELTRTYFEVSAADKPGAVGAAMKAFAADPNDQAAIAVLAEDPDYAGQLRTTCVATMVTAGHAPNALPQKAEATVNCRIFPGVSSQSVGQTLVDLIGDPAAVVTQLDSGSLDSEASPLREDVMAAVTRAVHARFPGVPLVPGMSAGATDSMHFRAVGVPSYGVSGLFMKSSDEFAHGLDERIPVSAIDGALDHWDGLLKDMAK